MTDEQRKAIVEACEKLAKACDAAALEIQQKQYHRRTPPKKSDWIDHVSGLSTIEWLLK